MAVLIPDVPKDCNVSERLVYERLGRDLSDDWIVLHSLGLPGHETKIWGEADIVILSAHGVFALEVKGGNVSCYQGVWTFGRPGAEGYSKREDPWTQAKGTMMAVREKLRAADPAFRNVLFGFGVVMPNTVFTVTGAEIVPEVLLDRRNYAQKLNLYISRLERHWQDAYEAKYGRRSTGLTPQQVKQARQILRPDLETALSIGGWLTGVEQRLLQLSNEQILASRRMAANPRTIVRGQAGTGKTIIALERARQLSEKGKRVLYLCFNQLLAAHIRSSLAGDARAALVDVHHAHALYRALIEKAGLLDRLRAEDREDDAFFARVFPELAAEAICLQDFASWDVLVVDEAQDLLTEAHLDVFDLLLAEGLQRGCWHFFLDPQQNIYATEIQEAAESRLDDARPAFEDLIENCRNTRQVAVQASIISGIDLAIAGAPDGLECESVFYDSDSDFLSKLDALVADLLARDVKPKDIAVLSTRKRENSLLAGVSQLGGRPLAEPTADDAVVRAGAILFSTMHAFKGLERMAVIAIDMDEVGQAHYAMLHYAGLSRACGLLRAFIPSARRPAYVRQAEAFGRRLRTA
jgi:hypothetical protein